ncbi:hypothetical protein [Actinomadura sp. 3N407]|uniref:hypothetical protein n=1 Tax=Actinomadura sp. 3N407 TaxID=3457423 RepID=UPI003FCE81C5
MAIRYAAAVSGPADSLDGAASRFFERVRSLDTGIRGILDFMGSTPRAEWPDEFESFLHEIVSFAAAYEEKPHEVGEAVAFLNWAGNISTAFRKPFKRMSDAITRVEKAFPFLQEWAKLAQGLLERPAPE